VINLGALEGNFTGRRVMINDFGAGAPDVIRPHVVQDIAFLVAVATRAMRDHARPCRFAFALDYVRGRSQNPAELVVVSVIIVIVWNRFISPSEMNEIVRRYENANAATLRQIVYRSPISARVRM